MLPKLLMPIAAKLQKNSGWVTWKIWQFMCTYKMCAVFDLPYLTSRHIILIGAKSLKFSHRFTLFFWIQTKYLHSVVIEYSISFLFKQNKYMALLDHPNGWDICSKYCFIHVQYVNLYTYDEINISLLKDEIPVNQK